MTTGIFTSGTTGNTEAAGATSIGARPVDCHDGSSSAVERERACSHDGDKPCTGCATGNPCPACLARMNRASEVDPAANE